MEVITELVHAVLHLDATLGRVAAEYGPWLYVLLFLVIFAETGLVVTPFLPGDSLLFVAGTVVAGTAGALSVHLLVALLIVAAILGDSVNYSIGRWIGPKVFEHDHRYIAASTCRRRRRSTTATARSRSSSAGSCRSCARSRRSSRASPACGTRASSRTT